MSRRLWERGSADEETRGRCSNESKDDVLRMAETIDKSLSELEQERGLSHGLIRKWRRRYQVGPVEGQLSRAQMSTCWRVL